ncbi:MAG: SAM-dependent methyltransferase [Butyrivibrio sp.]|nr:SAM-dependent methyltransferase [Butyrivibrio sp.]
MMTEKNENSGAAERMSRMDPRAGVAEKMSTRLLTVAGMLGELPFALRLFGSKSCDDPRLAENAKGNDCLKTGKEAGDHDFPQTYRCVADVGCDHGYVSVYLVQSSIAKSAIAMDVRSGPLAMAKGNVESFGLSDSVETRLSNGLEKLNPKEADALVIAGMGGKLMISILEKKSLSELGIRYAVLQPQSDIYEFRQFLRDNGFIVVDERIVFEDGKYYFPIKVKIPAAKSCKAFGDEGSPVGITEAPEDDDSFDIDRISDENGITMADGISKAIGVTDPADLLRICNRYGEINILKKDPLLEQFLLHGREVCGSIMKSLDKQSHSDRYNEVRQEAEDIDLLLKMF